MPGQPKHSIEKKNTSLEIPNRSVESQNISLENQRDSTEDYPYNDEGFYIHVKNRTTNYKVTVVMPVYNAELTVRKTIDSVINQTIGFENIEFIIVDDRSNDDSRTIILEYSETYPNVIPVFLKENTGSPAIPRNLGINLANGKYIIFIDSDDWFSENGLKLLYETLERTGNDYAIGKTIQVTDKRMKIVGEYNNCMARDFVDPYSIPHLFHHLGPTARMMKTTFIKDNNIKFPNMKFAEDKQFFIDVLTKCSTISTLDDVIYYANRLKENKSFTTTTSIFEKTDTNIKVIKYVIDKQLPEKIEKMILNRLYEFDCITRLFNRKHFLNSKEKEKYFEKFGEVLETTKNLNYDFTEIFFEPWHKVLVTLFKEERFDDITSLINWSLNESIKNTIVRDGLPYYLLPLNNENQFTRVNMLAYHKSSSKDTDSLLLRLNVYGDQINEMDSFVIRQRDNELNQIELPLNKVSTHEYEVKIPYEQIATLTSASYATFIKYSNYLKLFIKMDTRKIINFDDKTIDFYTTIGDNFGVNIK
ncbi:glycosyltransferase family 2 protein [Siminovitchia acidinfaciens]|uniref:Glycosyltransferase family 2 protein n=2 Tax=Siminovitchia acidinfaciens TaxID=2321395 RepID=A0A429Y058_9BACI|nr:glycosyltransferase family 2 protein [Siminovitchia acidinfaciens]